MLRRLLSKSQQMFVALLANNLKWRQKAWLIKLSGFSNNSFVSNKSSAGLQHDDIQEASEETSRLESCVHALLLQLKTSNRFAHVISELWPNILLLSTLSTEDRALVKQCGLFERRWRLKSLSLFILRQRVSSENVYEQGNGFMTLHRLIGNKICLR